MWLCEFYFLFSVPQSSYFFFLFRKKKFGWVSLLLSLHLFIFIKTYYGLFIRYKNVLRLIIFLWLVTIGELQIVTQLLKTVEGLLYALCQELATMATGQIRPTTSFLYTQELKMVFISFID